MKKALPIMIIWLTLFSLQAFAHCQVPCGIFDDGLRFSIMNEHAETVLKAMNQIKELSAAEKPDLNQIIRWTNTKDAHANDIIDICSNYFLCQRIKPATGNQNEATVKAYLAKLEKIHQLMISAMKCKHHTDTAEVERLKTLIHEFLHLYDEKAHKH